MQGSRNCLLSMHVCGVAGLESLRSVRPGDPWCNTRCPTDLDRVLTQTRHHCIFHCVVCISVVFLHANPSVLCTQDAQAPEPLHAVAMHGLRETAAEAHITHVMYRE